MKGGDASLRIERGEKSNSYFVIVYNVLLTLSIGVISVIPNDCIDWISKIFLLFILASLLFYACFRIKRFRNFIIKLFSGLENYEETS